MAVNVGSRRVLEKLGMRRVETYVGEWRDPIEGWEVVEEVAQQPHSLNHPR